MTTKIFDIKPEYKAGSLSRNWPIAILCWILFWLSFPPQELINYFILVMAIIFSCISIADKTTRSRINSYAPYSLEFGKESLLCKDKGSIIWHITYGRISHIETRDYGSGKWYSPKTRETLILTTDNDSYVLPGLLDESIIADIQKEISIAKTSV